MFGFEGISVGRWCTIATCKDKGQAAEIISNVDRDHLELMVLELLEGHRTEVVFGGYALGLMGNKSSGKRRVYILAINSVHVCGPYKMRFKLGGFLDISFGELSSIPSHLY